ncbi:putative glycolipid-binding domain-containing protein [Micromonospora sp. NPDC000207]|uniref:putative glycolipid-binding domain-containing protein n=1 Tax=Micromonospora sp. NPDC000207 TaxID=3154246 RepID=UPI003321C383
MVKSLFWSRTDIPGADHALVADDQGLAARGTLVAVDPVPYTCRYTVTTGSDWATERLDVQTEGAGWARSVRLEQTSSGWRVTTNEEGDLDGVLAAAGHPTAGLPGTDDPDRLADAVDVDLTGSVLFNTLPVRRLGLADAPDGTEHRITVAWVLLPGLVVVPSDQVYTASGAGRVGFASGTFTADLTLDPDGYVRHYPGLAERVAPR